MSKKVKRFLLSFLLLFAVVVSSFSMASCEKEPEITIEDLEAVVFADDTILYDGEKHSLEVEGLPEGVEVTYVDNGVSMPGVHEIKAIITYNNLRVTKVATLTINKLPSVLTADENQKVVLYGGNIRPSYTLDNKQQSITYKYTLDGKTINKNDIYKVGTYQVEMYAPENNFYLESNHVTINLEVVESLFDVCFESQEFIKDGNEKQIELSGTLPQGYTVEYVNNKATNVGTYYAMANIKDSTGTVVETHAATLSIDYPKNEEFEEYLDSFFVTYLEGDQLSVNIFCENPSDFGLLHYDAEWYTYESFEDEDLAEAKKQFEDLLAELHEYEDAELNTLQKVSYNNIEKLLTYYIDYYNIEDSTFMNIVYVDQFGGYVADFGTYMEAYSLRSELEVQDIVNYITSTKTAFPSYLEFVEDKTEAGYALSDYTITEMRSYLEDILEDGENYYLKDILFEKIDGVDFLNEDEKTSYKNQIADAIKNCFIPGTQELYDGLEEYIGKLAEEDEGYWSTYENGMALFELELEDLLGLDIDMDAYIAELDKALQTAVSNVISKQGVVVRQFNITDYTMLELVISQHAIFDGTPDEMVGYLKEFAKSIVPELKSDPEISIKNMDNASAKVSNAVAYYMKSALDNTSGEHITLNPLKLGDKNDVLGTMSHEGYPGHLYAYVYSKELDLHNVSKIMTSTAHGEGWATYVELALYEYAKNLSDDKEFDMIMDYLYANQVSGFLLETRIDAGIHYQGWTIEDIAKYMGKLGYSSDGAEDIYNLLIEMPTQYAAYGYGKLKFINLHTEAKKVLGGFYNEVEFNAMLLSKGWTNLGELDNTYNEYMLKKCHECGIEYKK